MPNGGYPMHYLIQIPGTEFAIHADGATIHLKRSIEGRIHPLGGTVPQYENIGTLTTEQLCGLLYHLNYWGINTSGGHIEDHGATFNGKKIQPQYKNAGCVYDY